jgi:mycothiol synthase
MLALTAAPPLDAQATVAIDDAADHIAHLPAAELPRDGASSLARAVAAARRGGARRLDLEAEPATGELDRIAEQCGFIPRRDLLQLRRPLPVDEPWELDVRPFRPGRDEQTWLDVNNRAFSWHPEQGGWTLDDLAAREREPWFDPGGLLLHEREGRLAGFCWTKVHGDHEPPLGEIFVIAVDPEFQGLGLGRPLTLAGLDHLAARGLSVGMLYVEADNLPARRLYDRLGFTLHHTKRWYTVDLA